MNNLTQLKTLHVTLALNFTLKTKTKDHRFLKGKKQSFIFG